MIGANVLGEDLDSAGLEGVWSAAERLGVPIVIHPMMPQMGRRLEDYYLRNLVGNPLDTTIAASRLIFGGVLDRHPKLRVVLLHGGGYLPYAIGRLNHGYKVRVEAKKLARPPSEYLKRFYYDAVVYNPKAL